MARDFSDQPRAVRAGEELAVDRLAAYLAAEVPDLTGPLTVAQFPAGYSNLTYLLQMGGRELVLRRPPFGVGKSSAHDMSREYRVLSALASIYPLAPRPIVYCADEAVLGAPFYVMERVPGVILRTQLPAGLALDVAVMRGLSTAAIDNLAAIHALPYAATPLVEGSHPAGYVQRQIAGWARRYAAAKTDDIPAIEQVIAWLEAQLPPESGAALIHNDYKYDNLVLDGGDLTQIRGVLDWEMATIGDPLLDLGTSLGYWVEADDPPALQATRFGLTSLPGNLTRAEVVARYAARSGRDVSNIVYYYVYGLFKIAVIAQQIYARYQQGWTQDIRFAGLHQTIATLGQMAAQASTRDRLDHLLD